MTESGAMQLLGVLCVDRGRDADPAVARLWARTMPDVPDRDVGLVARFLLREGAEYGRFPTCADVLAAWRKIRGERSTQRRRAEEQAERDALPALPPSEVRANIERVRQLVAAAAQKQLPEGHHANAANLPDRYRPFAGPGQPRPVRDGGQR